MPILCRLKYLLFVAGIVGDDNDGYFISARVDDALGDVDVHLTSSGTDTLLM